MKYILRILLEIGWRLDLIHVPEWDNIESPWTMKKEKAEPDAVSSERPNVVTRAWGSAEPGQVQELFQWVEESTGDGEWKFERFDGQDGYDFRDWGYYDDWVIHRRGYSDKQRNNYILLRPDVISGLTNKQICKRHGKSPRWADEYAGAVREMCELRARKEVESPSPTG